MTAFKLKRLVGGKSTLSSVFVLKWQHLSKWRSGSEVDENFSDAMAKL